MFTSRAEFRLTLRADNADARLTPKAIELGIASEARTDAFKKKMDMLDDARSLCHTCSITPNEAGRQGLAVTEDGVRRTSYQLLAYPGVTIERLSSIWPEMAGIRQDLADLLETEAKYAVYLERQAADILLLRREEAMAIPADFAYRGLVGLSTELQHKLTSRRPASIAEAQKIDGMTPAALALVAAAVRAQERHGKRLAS